MGKHEKSKTENDAKRLSPIFLVDSAAETVTGVERLSTWTGLPGAATPGRRRGASRMLPGARRPLERTDEPRVPVRPLGRPRALARPGVHFPQRGKERLAVRGG